MHGDERAFSRPMYKDPKRMMITMETMSTCIINVRYSPISDDAANKALEGAATWLRLPPGGVQEMS